MDSVHGGDGAQKRNDKQQITNVDGKFGDGKIWRWKNLELEIQIK